MVTSAKRFACHRPVARAANTARALAANANVIPVHVARVQHLNSNSAGVIGVPADVLHREP
jgi:hypothetical protein